MGNKPIKAGNALRLQRTCNRCGYTWISYTKKPKTCPECRSPYWNKERKMSTSAYPVEKYAISRVREVKPQEA
jgi:ribosomal protein L37E